MAAKNFLIVLCLLALVQTVVSKTIVLKWTRGKLSASGGRLDHKNRALYVRMQQPDPCSRESDRNTLPGSLGTAPGGAGSHGI
jgi:hypothetical protein